MNDTTSIIGNMIRQAFILLAIVGLTFAAGINWAEAATPHASTAGVSPVPAILLFMAAIGTLFGLLIQPQQRARVRARVGNRRR